jgi:hypothetical protein
MYSNSRQFQQIQPFSINEFNIPIKIILNNRRIYLSVPSYYTVNDIITDLIIVYNLETDGLVYSLYCDSQTCILWNETYLDPNMYICDLENDMELVLILKKDNTLVFKIKQIINKVKQMINLIVIYVNRI